ncbi:MBL fold metallo-hydrolase [Candidatus Zixiibacteriota bacterium]
MNRREHTLLLILLAIPAAVSAQSTHDMGVTRNRLSDRVAVFQTAAGSEPTSIIALQSEQGIVVIDTERSPRFTSDIRAAIEEEFTGDFIYLINTHGHGDHTYGNQVFSEATIIAHENCVAEMEEAADRIDGTVGQISAMLPRWKNQVESLEAGSDEAESLAGMISYYEQMVSGFTDGFTVSLPNLTFHDHMTLNLGDLTLELTWHGHAHSSSDILIYCPEEQLLLTGDLFYTGGLPTYIDSERIPYLSRWHEIIDALMKRDEGIAHIVTGHEESLPISSLGETLTFIAQQRDLYAGRESALNTFRDVHLGKGVEAGLDRLREMHADSTHFYALRPELDTYAYRLMLDEKLDEALKMFLLFAELWPESDISWDSLGEVYLRLEQKEKAIEAFEASLKLNPENRNAIQRLAQLKG